MRSRAVSGFLIGTVISAACLWYAFRTVEMDNVVRSMLHVGVGWVLTCAVFAVVSFIFRAWRWRYLLPDWPGVGTWSLMSATFIGGLANNVLPARLGEVVRAWVLAKLEDIPGSAVFGSVVIERLVDAASVIALLGACLFFSPALNEEAGRSLQSAGRSVAVLAAAVFCLALIAVYFRERLLRICDRMASRAERPWVDQSLVHLRRFLDGCCAFRSAKQAGIVVGLSLLVRGADVASYYVLAEGFHFSLSLIQVSLVFVIVVFGVALPAAPGFIGTFHGFCVVGLTLAAGIDSLQAAAYATLLHACGWITINLVGATCLLVDRSLWLGLRVSLRTGR